MQRNGKSIMRPGRKHQNLIKKQYIHKHPVIDKIVNGNANNILVAGQNMMNILRMYDTHFEQGKVKILGNSGVAIKMQHDRHGKPMGFLVKR